MEIYLNGTLDIEIKKYIYISLLNKIFEKSKKYLYKFGILKYLRKLKKRKS